MESLFNIVATLVKRDSNIGAKYLPTPPYLSAFSQLSISNFEKEGIRKKMNVWGDLNSSCNG